MEKREPKRQKLVIESPSSSSDEECCIGRPKQSNVSFKIDTKSLPKEEAVNSEVISQTIRPQIDFPYESTKRRDKEGNTDETKPCPQNDKARELKRSLQVKACISLVKSTVETVSSSSSRKKSEKKGKSNNDDSKVIVDLTACSQRKETLDLTDTSKKPLDLTASNLKETFDLTRNVSKETIVLTMDSDDEAVIVVSKPLQFASRKNIPFKIAPKQTIQLRQVNVAESLSLIKPPPMRPFPTTKPFPRIKLPPARLPFKSPPQARENVARLPPRAAATGYDSDDEDIKQKRDETNECVSVLDSRKPAAVPKDGNAVDNILVVVSTQGSKTSHVKSAKGTTIDKRKRDETNECVSVLDDRKPAAVPKDVNAVDNILVVVSTQGSKTSHVKSAKGTTIDKRKRDETNECVSVLDDRKPAAVPKDVNAFDDKAFPAQGSKTSHVKSAKGTTIDKRKRDETNECVSVLDGRKPAAVPKDGNAVDNKVFSAQGSKTSHVKSAKGTTIDKRKRDETNECVSVLDGRKPAAVPKDGNAVDNKVFSTQGSKTSHFKGAKGTTIDKYFSPVRGTVPSVTEPRRSALDRNFSPKRELPISFGSGRKRMSIPEAQTSGGFGFNNQQRLLASKPVSNVVDLLLSDSEQEDSSVPNGMEANRPEEDDFDIATELAKFPQPLDTNQTIEDDFDIQAELAKFPQPLDTSQTIEDDFDVEAELAKFPQPERVGPYTYDEFVGMYNYVQDNLGITFGEVERGSLVKKANNNMDEADTKQRSAMYGEIEPKMAKVRRVFEGFVVALGLFHKSC